jgi:hypothetical protein
LGHLRIEDSRGGTVRFTSDLRTPVLFAVFLILSLLAILMDVYGSWIAHGGGPHVWRVIKLVLECAGWLFMAFGMMPVVRWSVRRALDRCGRALLEEAMARGS